MREEDPGTVEVGSSVARSSPELLWRHVHRGSVCMDRIMMKTVCILELGCDPEVEDLGHHRPIAVPTKEYVARLDITMNDALAVSDIETGQNIEDDFDCALRGQGLMDFELGNSDHAVP